MKALIAILLVISVAAGSFHVDRPRLCPYKMRCPPPIPYVPV